MKNLLFICFILICSFQSVAQEDTLSHKIENSVLTATPKSEVKKNFMQGAWFPIGLSLVSIDLMRDSAKYGLQTLVRSVVEDTFFTHWDDWIQYGPVVTMYTADLFHVPAKNTVWNQTKFLIISELVTAGIVQGLKHSLKIQRPNNGAFNAYPSGHTSQAFVQSQVLFNEYRETAPLLAASGFLFSVPTGVLRVLNNKHWAPDVFLGAGIAILVTNAVYHFEPLKNWNPFKNIRDRNKNLHMSFMPSFGENYLGGRLKIKF